MTVSSVFWGYIALKALLLIVGSALTAVSYRTYRRNRRSPFRVTTYAFAIITVGVLSEGAYALYDFWANDAYHLVGLELLVINSVESVLILGGLAFLFYSIYSM